MFRRWVAFASLGFALPACGERAGDPILARPGSLSDAGAPSEGQGGEPALPGAAGGGAGPNDAGPLGLCARCSDSESCGDANDACLRRSDGELFCGRDCDEGLGCPDGYICTELDNSRLRQCAPIIACPAEVNAAPELADVRDYLLARINLERSVRGRELLEASSCLDELAQSSAVAYAQSDEPLGKFVKECDPVWPNCTCGWSAESEVTVAHYGLEWTSAADGALADPRFVSSLLLSDVVEVGIGFWISGDEAWIALSFR